MKRGLNILLLFGIFILLGLSIVSAGLISNIWVRTTGNVILPNCTSSCASLGYQCGTANICGNIVNCGTCSTGYACAGGKCMPQNNTCVLNTSCSDNNFCTRDLCSGGNCINYPITSCVNSDGCCPKLCSLINDNDCYSTNQTPVLTTNTCIDRDNGINYYQKSSLDFAPSFTAIIKEGEKINVSGTYVSIAFIDYTSVRFNVDELIITAPISQGETYSDGGYTIKVNKINYSDKIYGINRVEFTLYSTKTRMSFVDFCINSALLDEFYCEGNLTFKNITYDCRIEGKTCSDGACVVAPKCNDSDGGLDYYIKGTVTYVYSYLSTIPNDKSSVTDFCSGNYLNEAYCFSATNGLAQFGWKGITCKYGCSNGACKKLLGVFR